jgi:hypothetical protein
MMKKAGLSLLIAMSLGISASADLTIVQRVEGVGPAADMTIKIKGEKARIDANPQLTTIIDGNTGEMVNLMKDQKRIVRISAKKMKAAVEMINKYDGSEKKAAEAKPKFVATGKKEKINGYDTEEYLYEASTYKAAYWVAPKYPEGGAILKQLQSLNSEMWRASNMNMPDYRDFPGVPIKTVASMGGNQITTTLTSIKQDPIDDSEFVVPKDFQEMKLPDIGNLLRDNGKKPTENASPPRATPH